MSERKEPQFVIKSVREGWHAPGYRDPELHLFTSEGRELHVRLTPEAFVQLHNALAMQQACIDHNKHAPLDMDVYPSNTTHVCRLRTPSECFKQAFEPWGKT